MYLHLIPILTCFFSCEPGKFAAVKKIRTVFLFKTSVQCVTWFLAKLCC